MTLPPIRNAESRPRQRRLLAMAATVLFAFCVLIASAPHRHLEGESRARRGDSRPAIVAAEAAPVACALCDWLYAPTIPADAPPVPAVEVPVVRPILPPAIVRVGGVVIGSEHSSSRGPPALLAAQA